MKLIKIKWAIWIVLLLNGCALRPTPEQVADQHHFEKQVVITSHFKHLVYARRPLGAQSLHVYIEGDGRSWIDGVMISDDPTPHNPLVLQLMAQDKSPSVYVGRPCHFLLQQDAACEPNLWTFARYSPTVVASMVEATNQVVLESGAHQVVLIGYSGGGTLAMLMASQVKNVSAVVTIAANLDTDAWTRIRGFEPLTGSVNPINQPPLAPEISQLHLMGYADTTVPPPVTRSYINRFNQDGHLREQSFPGFDHVCCWVDQWPQILLQIERTN